MTDEDLVIRAEKIIHDRLADLADRHGESGRTQLSNAIEVAQTTQYPLVFSNWLRYQRAREDFWRIGGIAGSDIATEAHQAIEAIVKNSKRDEAMRMVVRFLGFLRRALVAKEYFKDMPAGSRKENA
jgi:hypothetical protein